MSTIREGHSDGSDRSLPRPNRGPFDSEQEALAEVLKRSTGQKKTPPSRRGFHFRTIGPTSARALHGAASPDQSTSPSVFVGPLESHNPKFPAEWRNRAKYVP